MRPDCAGCGGDFKVRRWGFPQRGAAALERLTIMPVTEAVWC